LYASKNFNRGVLLKNADFQRQNKKTYVRKSKMQSGSAPSSPSPYNSSPLSSKRLSTDELGPTRSVSSDEEDIGTLSISKLASPTKAAPSESTTSFNNININITNSSSNLGTTTDVTVTQQESSLHAIATAASIVATTTTAVTTATAINNNNNNINNNSAPSSPSLNINNLKRRKIDNNNNNNSNYSNLNVHVKVDVSFEETVSGCKKTIEYDCFVMCDKCGGNGRAAAATQQMKGANNEEGSACAQCNGMVWKTKKRLEVDILPNGVKNGFKKTYKGLGSKGEDGTSGDLIVEFVVANHPFYRRNSDDDTICECHISVYQAVLGTKIQIPKLYGTDGEKVEVSIEPGIQPNTVIRMPNQGMTKSNCKKKRGDLYIHILIDIPTQLSQHQKDLFERLATIDSMLDLHLSRSPSSPPSSPLPVITKSHSTSSLPNAVLLKTEK
jgi:DnaJ-class molecular chaperone